MTVVSVCELYLHDICQETSGDDKGFEHSRVLQAITICSLSASEDITSSTCLSESILRYADRGKRETRPGGNYYQPSQCFSLLYWHDELRYMCIANAILD